MSSSLLRRIVVALVGIPAVFVLIYLGDWVFSGALAVLGGVGAWEFDRLAGPSGVRPLRGWGVTAAVLLPFGVLAVLDDRLTVTLLLGSVALWVMAVFATAVKVRPPAQRPLASVAVTVLGAAYAGGLLCFAIFLRHADPSWESATGTALLFLPLVLIWVGDVLAMAAGATVGGMPLAPVISPKKTWAGAIAHTSSAAVVAPLYGVFVLQRHGILVNPWLLVGIGIAVSVAGQVGDLAESLLKREAGVKDSGTFFSGHGGVLDRLDALYWAFPVVVFLLALLGVV